LLLTPKPFTPLLRQLKEAVEEETEETFDTVWWAILVFWKLRQKE